MDSMAPFSSMICLYLKKCDVPLRKLQTAHDFPGHPPSYENPKRARSHGP